MYYNHLLIRGWSLGYCAVFLVAVVGLLLYWHWNDMLELAARLKSKLTS